MSVDFCVEGVEETVNMAASNAVAFMDGLGFDCPQYADRIVELIDSVGIGRQITRIINSGHFWGNIERASEEHRTLLRDKINELRAFAVKAAGRIIQCH